MIRSFQLRDVHLVSRLQRAGVSLDLEEKLTHPRSPLRSVLLDSALSPRQGPTTFILKQKDDMGQLQGLAQLRRRAGRPERVVVFMSPRLDAGPGSAAIWQRLITHMCVHTAQWGTLRIYARLAEGSDESHLFKTMGFQEYCHEDIYELESSAVRTGPDPALELRPQHPGDGWGLQKLYASQTPRGVQNAEGLAQGQWELAKRRWGEQGRRYGYVWEVDGELVGALHLRVGKRGYWIRTLLHPDMFDQSPRLCRAALKLTTKKPQRPVFFAVRQYEPGWSHNLPELGFTPITSQVLMVKPMTVRVRKQNHAVLPSLEKGNAEGATPSVMTHAGLEETYQSTLVRE